MDILFVGCSITWGDELKDRLNTRYSKLLCDALGANEYNVAECGTSNDWIARRTVEETRKRKYDRVYVQLTMPSRLEYFNEEGPPHKFHHHMVKQKDKPYYTEGRWYYKFVWNKQFGLENMYKNKFIIESVVDSELVFLFADSNLETDVEYQHLHDRSYWNSFSKIKSLSIFKGILQGHYENLKKMPKSEIARLYPLGKRGHPLESSHQKIADYLLEYGYHSH